ncbi:inositol monophosphatase family protein [uncultured Draconibacterium sp.]|uniref:3'(2'),5'-bisphosphate nucleotidase CysQ family protein n=1 Tax=uncultured Draconibacterium sp. TaxID=1573823 RepID=UPI003216284C
MILTSKDLDTLCKKAIEAACCAGELISTYTNKNVLVQSKKGVDSLASQVVTEVDVKAQGKILEILNPTLSEFDLALLTEESADNGSRFTKDYFWCIDPMDGTLAFTEKTPGYAVSIALVAKDGESQIGVVFDPVKNILYHAIKGQGTYKNEQPWHPDLVSGSGKSFIWHMDRSFLNHSKYSSIKIRLEEFVSKAGFSSFTSQKNAGAVLNAIWLLENFGCYFKLPKPTSGGGSLWDFAATSCIINEANAYGKSFDGSPLDLNRPDSTFMNHKGALYASNVFIAKNIREILNN